MPSTSHPDYPGALIVDVDILSVVLGPGGHLMGEEEATAPEAKQRSGLVLPDMTQPGAAPLRTELAKHSLQVGN